MANIINWVVSNIGNICSAICSVILISSIIVKLTPSTKDNELLHKLISILDKFSVVKTYDDKKYIEEAKRHLE